eukprot:COSAG05_NODE_4321_length_1567_cov_329.445504_2_plen_79_part_00
MMNISLRLRIAGGCLFVILGLEQARAGPEPCSAGTLRPSSTWPGAATELSQVTAPGSQFYGTLNLRRRCGSFLGTAAM